MNYTVCIFKWKVLWKAYVLVNQLVLIVKNTVNPYIFCYNPLFAKMFYRNNIIIKFISISAKYLNTSFIYIFFHRQDFLTFSSFIYKKKYLIIFAVAFYAFLG